MKKLFLLLGAALFVFAPAACVNSDAEDEEESDGESEPETSSDAITGGTSSVDCKKTRMTAYDRGKPYSIDVIKIGSKRVSQTTGHAFLKLQKAASNAGVRLTISSGFRTMDEQKYFYDCYKTKSCNNGNLAARPGYSNHQNGRALDLSRSAWLASNAGKFGFKQTVRGEPWHYEYSGEDPGGPCATKVVDDDDTKGDGSEDAGTSEASTPGTLDGGDTTREGDGSTP